MKAEAQVQVREALSRPQRQRNGRSQLIWPGIAAMSCLAGAFMVGCTTKSKAELQARKAFIAGQQQALMTMQQNAQPTVRVLGQVKTPVIDWSEGMTLAKAVVAAEYVGNGTPRALVLVRNGRAVTIDPNQLLKGEDVPLEPGDIVEIRP